MLKYNNGCGSVGKAGVVQVHAMSMSYMYCSHIKCACIGEHVVYSVVTVKY